MIRLGVLGYGAWGRNVARVAAATAGARLVAIADTNPSQLAQAQLRHPHVDLHADHEKLVHRRDIDAVIIATSAPTHPEVALLAAASGKHMLVEKPFALDPESAHRIATAAEDARVLMQVGHLLRYHPAVDLLCEVARSDLGTIRSVAAQRLNYGRVRSDENVLFSLGPHDLSVMLQLFGAPPISVAAQGAAYVREGVEDLCFVTLRFPNGGIGQMHLSWLDPHKVRRMTVVGDEGMAVFDDMAPREKVRVYDQGFDASGASGVYGENLAHRTGNIRIPAIPPNEPLSVEIADFVACIAERRSPRANALEGIAVTEILHAAQSSMRSGGNPVQLI
ncbi:MAG: Gfo/Idh/MocA family protein [Planctomycetota bacterium]|jgi:predicted dehydrogenase